MLSLAPSPSKDNDVGRQTKADFQCWSRERREEYCEDGIVVYYLIVDKRTPDNVYFRNG